jgi:iron complex outermembrane receptor protein
VGELTTQEAFTQILAGTGLTYRYLDEKTVTIVPVASTQAQVQGQGGANSTDKEGKKASSSEFRLAQAERANTTESPTSQPNPPSGPTRLKRNDDEEVKLEEVVVTGTRLSLTKGQQVLPVSSYGRETIENSGQNTLATFLSTLPQVSTTTNTTSQLGYMGVETVRLHGLPIGTTLTLLDGQRLETNILGFFDLSNIPTAAVERVDVLPVGASSVYGADALGGAVNFVLRKNLDGFEANANVTHATGLTDSGVNVAWGKRGERAAVSLIASFQDRGELYGTERAPTSLTQVPIAVPIDSLSALGIDECLPGNVYSVDGSNLPGLNSPVAGIPAGITGVPTGQQFAATAGKPNVCSNFRFRDITPHAIRKSALVSAHYRLTDSFDAYTDILLARGSVQAVENPYISVTQSFGGTVASNNPYNPFGVPVNVSFAYPGQAGQGFVESQSTWLIRPMVGVRGALGSDWHVDANVVVSRDRFHDRLGGFTDFQAVANALASSDPATALNPFSSTMLGSPQLLASLTDPAVDYFDSIYDDSLVNGQVLLRGPLWRGPAGPLQSVFGVDGGHQIQDTYSSGFGSVTPPLLLHRNTYALFTEQRVPLMGAIPNHSGDRLALTLAARYDHSNDFGGKATWQSGLVWRATDSVTLSGSYGTSYRAPQLAEVSGPQSVATSIIGGVDPFRGNEQLIYNVQFIFGPNFHLKPETGDSLTFGLAYGASSTEGFRTSVNWYALKISNYIGIEPFQVIIDNPALFPGAVIRGPRTAQDQQLGYLGQIIQFNDLYYNFGDLRISGVDADIHYALPTRFGEFTPSIAVSNIYRWESAILPGQPAIDAVSRATFSGVGWAPRWKGTATLAWKKGALSASLSGRYLGKYLDYQESVPNNNQIGNSWILDASAHYEFGEWPARWQPWIKRAYLSVGAVNLTNKIPPFSYEASWYDVEQYDIRGRYYFLNVGLRQ